LQKKSVIYTYIKSSFQNELLSGGDFSMKFFHIVKRRKQAVAVLVVALIATCAIIITFNNDTKNTLNQPDKNFPSAETKSLNASVYSDRFLELFNDIQPPPSRRGCDRVGCLGEPQDSHSDGQSLVQLSWFFGRLLAGWQS
jgi:hypothetical protein